MAVEGTVDGGSLLQELQDIVTYMLRMEGVSTFPYIMDLQDEFVDIDWDHYCSCYCVTCSRRSERKPLRIYHLFHNIIMASIEAQWGILFVF